VKKNFEKILLINPPIEDFYQTKIRQEPLGLSYIYAVLREKNKSVKFLDALNVTSHQMLSCPEEFSYLKSFYPPDDLSPFKLFTRFQHFGMPFNTIEQQIQAYQPEVIGISANFSPYIGSALKIANIAKQNLPEVIIVLGGHHASAVPEELARVDDIDFIVIGEGECTFLKLIECLSANDFEKLKNLDGIAFRDNGQVRVNLPTSYIQPLDKLPYPVLNKPAKAKMLLTSRGCPRNCHFCSIKMVMGRKIRLREISAIIQEIEHWIRRGITHFDFEDDNLAFYPERAKQLFKTILKRLNTENLSFSAMNGVSAGFLDEELLQLMKRLNFTWLNLPLVSGNPSVQAQINRHQSKDKFVEIVTIANRIGLGVIAYLILGLPENSLESMLSDILFLAEKHVLIGPSIFYPPPGTKTYHECLKKGYIKPRQYVSLRSSAIPVETKRFDRRDIITLFRLIRAINFTKKLLDEGGEKRLNAHEFFESWICEEPILSKCKLSPETIGFMLLSDLFIKNELRGIRLAGKQGHRFRYQRFEYDISSTLVNEFLKKLNGKTIRGVTSRNAFYF